MERPLNTKKGCNMRVGTIKASDFIKGTSTLYAVNPKTGENEVLGEFKHEDALLVGRGYPIGHYFGTIKEVNTRKSYIIKQADCGAGNCHCAITAEEV